MAVIALLLVVLIPAFWFTGRDPLLLFGILILCLAAMGVLYLISGGGQLPPLFYLLMSTSCIIALALFFIILFG